MKLASPKFLLALSLCPLAVQAAPTTNAKKGGKLISSSIESVFERAKANRAQIELAWKQTPKKQKPGMLFLLHNAPDSDLQTLSAAFLRAQVQLAFEARDKAPWKTSVSEPMFFNDVLPYASLTEKRDDVRGSLRKMSLPLISGITSPGEAALTINRKLFPLVKVKYSTERARPDQDRLLF